VNPSRRAYLLIKELGPFQLIPFALYQMQLRNGTLKRQIAPPCPTLSDPLQALKNAFLFDLSTSSDKKNPSAVIKAADEVTAGSFHPFSGETARLDLTLPFSTLLHWTGYSDQVDGQDIKKIWEPARFSWVFQLCQAYCLHADDALAHTFWHHLEIFLAANPEGQGPNWVSAQEVALRFIPWLFAAQTFQNSSESTPERWQLLVQAIWQGTARIALTLNYSRSQNNNHLLSEALGLMLGGRVFCQTSLGRRWWNTGLKEFQRAILNQVETDGTYSQHSTNYHRLMLHLALLAQEIVSDANRTLSSNVKERLAQATRWLSAQIDEASGWVPNLGHNDGSNLLPFGCCDYLDYRPIVQAASLAFLGSPCLPRGPWDELSHWLGFKTNIETSQPASPINSPAVLRLGDRQTWATLRSVQFHSRPAHADLLHVDLWHNGINLLADAGTYAYNLPEPWQNRLSSTLVHNTVIVAGQNQMLRDGKFLWLGRARAFALPVQPKRQAAILYCNLPVAYTQARTLIWLPGQGFTILDQIELARLEKVLQSVSIQFLLPDWHWQFADNTLTLTNQKQQFSLHISAIDPADHSAVAGTVSLVRAGESLLGNETNPIRGWFSPTYLVKNPALSLMLTYSTTKSLEIKTELNL
jgi:hypothetical protein